MSTLVRFRTSPPTLGPLGRAREAPWIWTAAGTLGLAFLAHTWLTIAAGGTSFGLDVPLRCTVELGAGFLALLLARRARRAMVAGQIMGIALTAWALADITATIRHTAYFSLNLWVPVGLHLSFYVLAATGLILFVHGDLGQTRKSDLLDALIGGLGIAAACAALTFQNLPHPTGNSAATVSAVVVPIANAALAALVGGCLAAILGRRSLGALLAVVGVLLNVVGVSAQILGTSGDGSTGAAIIRAVIVPAGALTTMLAITVVSTGIFAAGRKPVPEFLLPNLAGAGALAIEFASLVTPVNRVALLLAGCTLLVSGLRLFILMRRTEALSAFRQTQASTDELTGVFNRRHLFKVLDTFFSRRSLDGMNAQLAFLFVDMNRFKEINDSFGHPAGDQLLKMLADRLSGSLRDSDILARLGGDEFAVVLPGSDVEGAITVARRLVDSLEHSFQLDRVTASIGASIGVAVAPKDAQDSESLLWCADTAMYRAKVENSHLACYEETIDVERDRIRLLDELRTAVQEDELLLYYQPQLDLKTGAVAGVEALLRWNHPRLGLLAPVSFLSVAEETGEISSVTDWVIARALGQLSVWRSRGLDITASINISPSTLIEPDFLRRIANALERYQMPPSAVVLEITENWVTAQFDVARGVIGSLSALGITVSVDDFGAGATSLTYLRDLEANELKLDRAFVTTLDTESGGRDLELVRSTIDLGHAMGLRIVAEGVEDQSTLDLLTSLGCDLAQGYHISKPKPPNELALRPMVSRRAA